MHTTTGAGRPRSQQARAAVLYAVDDLLVEVGYAAMTMKGIAERAGVGRQTVYRWWSTKAEILLEAMVADAREELAVPLTGDPDVDLRSYLDALVRFLTTSTAGAAYRALLGEAQHDQAVAALVTTDDVLFASARALLASVTEARGASDRLTAAAALLAGPVLGWILTGQDPADLPREPIVRSCLDFLDGSASPA